MANKPLKTIKFPGLDDTYTIPQVDTTLAVSGAAADAKKTGDEISALKQDLQEFPNGNYPNMTVGNAEQLVSSQYVENSVPYLFRTTGGSADVGNREYVDAIVGGSLVWNQLIDSTSVASRTINGITYTNDNNGTITATGTSTARSNFLVDDFASVPGHKYVALGSAPNPSPTTHYISILEYLDQTYVRSFGVYGNNSVFAASANTNRIVVEIVGAQVAGYEANTLVFTPQLIDLTQMFGSTIADYIYSLETATAGAGVAWFKNLFPNMDAEYSYHEDSFDEESPLITKKLRDYQPGILMSVEGLSAHNTIGFNQWDEECVNGVINADGSIVNVDDRIVSKNFIRVLPNTQYYVQGFINGRAAYYDSEKNFIGYEGSFAVNHYFTTPVNAQYMKFSPPASYGTTYNHDICINLSWSGTHNGEYQPYEKHSYPLDDSLTLRGIPKLDSNNELYYDGDRYLADGTVQRRYGVVDLGTLNWTYFNFEGHLRFAASLSAKAGTMNLMCTKYKTVSYGDAFNNLAVGISIHTDGSQVAVYDPTYTDAAAFKAAMSGVMLVYELATPTEETADPYQEVQICNDWGTEEYVLTDTAFPVPVGHETRYPANLRDKLQHLPDLADADGYYAIKQVGTQMSLELFRIPKAPTSPDGTYILKATVSGGTPTYIWVADE